MIPKATFRVEDADSGKRLDAFILERVPATRRSLIGRSIERHEVDVDGRQAKKGYKIRAGEVVAIRNLLETADWKASPNPAVNVAVLHEDPALLVVDKPTGVPVHPLDPEETDTLVNGLLAAYPETAGVGPDPLFPSLVHRLDTETSGIMIAARDNETYNRLRHQFGDRKLAKRYIALVCGPVSQPAILRHHLVHDSSGTHRMVAMPEESARARDAMLAVTEYAVARSFARHTLLDVTLHTGVTHQIRCQLASVGHPIAGDALYGSAADDAGYRGRLFLHASEIGFTHPLTGQAMVFSAPLPQDLSAALQQLT